jgi:gamma-glutamyl phosphate reductase
MDIATLSTVISKLQGEVDQCHEMMVWAVEKRDEKSVDIWANCKVQAQKSLNAVETMLENEIAYREHTTAVYEEAA